VTLLLPLLVFIITTGGVMSVYSYILRSPQREAQHRVESRLRDINLRAVGDRSVLIRGVRSPLPAADRWLANTAVGAFMVRFIDQSGVRTTPVTMILWSLAIAPVGGGLVWLFVRFPGEIYVGALAGFSLPWLYLLRKRRVRLRKFEEQFPEALDLLSRALRAGHAFQTGMGMAADELPSPVGPEFKRTYERQNFGLALRDALDELCDRVPLMDVRFFVTAVTIQRETGGNLSEILDNLSRVVRERFRLLRQVRVHTAHGRFTGYVLLALPASLGVVLWRMNPDMMTPLFVTSTGQMMLGAAMVLQTVGFLWIRRVINIEV
jgi:tight adherence protein B